jgi:hypothetical protein
VSKGSIALTIGVALVAAALKVLLGYEYAVAVLLVGAALIAYVMLTRGEEAADTGFFTTLPRIAPELLEMRDSDPKIIIRVAS